MKKIDPNYQSKDSYQSFPDGETTVDSFAWVTTDDKTKEPILRINKNGVLQGILRFKNGDSQGPPMSVTLPEMTLLVKAFGKSPHELPPRPAINESGKVAEYMKKIQEICRGQIKVEVNGGWVNSITEVPKGLFYFVLDNMGPGTPPEPREGQFGKWYLTEWKIVAGEGGQPTPYEGLTFVMIANYGIVVNEDGQPDWEKGEGGGWTPNAVQMSQMINMTAPQMFEGDFNPSNPHNVLPTWLAEAKKANQVLKGYRVEYTPRKGKNAGKTSIVLEWSTVEQVHGFQQTKQQESYNPPLSSVEESEDEDVRARNILKTALTQLAGAEAVTSDWQLTPAGKTVAKQYLVPLKNQGILPHAYIQRYSLDNVLACMDALIESGDQVVIGLHANLTEQSIGFGQKEEEDDSPF